MFLREEEIRLAQDLLFFAYRDFTDAADVILDELGLGRAHHRALHFIGRNPGINVSDLLAILRITKQSLARVLSGLIESGYVTQTPGIDDRRQRLLSLTPPGRRSSAGCSSASANGSPPPIAKPARRRRRLPPRHARDHGRGGTRLCGRRGGGAPAYARARRLSGMSDSAHILVVDDDARLRALLSRYLAENGFRVTTAESAAEARARLRSFAPDLMVLDLMMPGESGLALTEQLRRDANGLPVLMLTARAAPEDRIAGFEAGADDYLPKPFAPLELVLRIRAMLRRASPPMPERRRGRFRSAPRCSTPNAASCAASPGAISLTAGEAGLLGALAQRPHEVLTREELAAVLGMEEASERAIDVQVTRLRRKIEPDPREPRFLLTVRGRGYMLKPGAG